LREARKSKSAVATEKILRKEKWQNSTGGLDTADLTRAGAKKSEHDELRLAKQVLYWKSEQGKLLGNDLIAASDLGDLDAGQGMERLVLGWEEGNAHLAVAANASPFALQ